MQLRIKGTSKKFESDIKRAVKFYWNKLGITEEDEITLFVKIQNFSKKDDKYRGFCAVDGPLEYTILINRNSKLKLRTLAHEMVHLKQYMHGEVDVDNDDFWKGELWAGPEDPEEAYHKAPWEVEARKKEDDLYQRWLLNESKNREKRGKSNS